MTLLGSLVALALVAHASGDCVKSHYPDYFTPGAYRTESLRSLVEQYPDSANAIVASTLGLTPPVCLARVETYGGGALGMLLLDDENQELRMWWAHSAWIVGQPKPPSYLELKEGRFLLGSGEERAAILALWLCAGAEDSEQELAASIAQRAEDQRNVCAATVGIEDPSRGAAGSR